MNVAKAIGAVAALSGGMLGTIGAINLASAGSLGADASYQEAASPQTERDRSAWSKLGAGTIVGGGTALLAGVGALVTHGSAAKALAGVAAVAGAAGTTSGLVGWSKYDAVGDGLRSDSDAGTDRAITSFIDQLNTDPEVAPYLPYVADELGATVNVDGAIDAASVIAATRTATHC